MERSPVDVQAFRASMAEAGVEHIVPEVLASFLGDLQVRVRELREGIESGALEGTASVAHALKSAAGTVQARELHRLLERIEKAARVGDAGGVRETFLAIEGEAASVVAFLSNPENRK